MFVMQVHQPAQLPSLYGVHCSSAPPMGKPKQKDPVLDTWKSMLAALQSLVRGPSEGSSSKLSGPESHTSVQDFMISYEAVISVQHTTQKQRDTLLFGQQVGFMPYSVTQ